MYTMQRAADTVRLDHHDLWPYRHLAVRVLASAFADLEDPFSTAVRESARRFLAGSDLFHHWCRVADLNPECVTRYAARLTDGR